MTEDAPIIIAGSEEKRGDQLRRQQAVKRLINSGKKIEYQKPIHMEEESIEQFQTYPAREFQNEKEPKTHKEEPQANK